MVAKGVLRLVGGLSLLLHFERLVEELTSCFPRMIDNFKVYTVAGDHEKSDFFASSTDLLNNILLLVSARSKIDQRRNIDNGDKTVCHGFVNFVGGVIIHLHVEVLHFK